MLAWSVISERALDAIQHDPAVDYEDLGVRELIDTSFFGGQRKVLSRVVRLTSSWVNPAGRAFKSRDEYVVVKVDPKNPYNATGLLQGYFDVQLLDGVSDEEETSSLHEYWRLEYFGR
jgi:hypothetical protein